MPFNFKFQDFISQIIYLFNCIFSLLLYYKVLYCIVLLDNFIIIFLKTTLPPSVLQLQIKAVHTIDCSDCTLFYVKNNVTFAIM